MYLSVTAFDGQTSVKRESGSPFFTVYRAQGATECYSADVELDVQRGAFVTVDGEVTVWAAAGSHVTAFHGAVVYGLYGSRVYSHEGSHVVAENGCDDTAYDGSDVLAEAGSHVTACLGSHVVVQPGAVVDYFAGADCVWEDGRTYERNNGLLAHRSSGR